MPRSCFPNSGEQKKTNGKRMKENFMERTELEKRKPIFDNRAIFLLLWPVLIEQTLASTVGIADTIMVSSVGDAAVSAVGLIDTINNMFIQIFTAIATGTTVVVAQLSGRRDTDGIHKTVGQSSALMTMIMTLIGLIVILFGAPIFDLLYPKVETAVRSDALLYFRMTGASYPFFALMIILTGIFRGSGNTRTPMRISLWVNVINIVLNAVFIYGLHMGVVGAALATLIARMVGTLMMVAATLRKYGRYVFRWKNLRFTGRILKPVLNISLPSGLDTALFQGGRLIVSIFVARMATAAISANTVAGSMFGLICIPGNSFHVVATTVAGQCYGAGKRCEARRNLMKCTLIAVGMLAALSVALYWVAPYLVSAYRPSAEAKPIAVSIVRLYLVMIPLSWPTAFVTAGGLRAVDDVRFVTLVSIPSMWIVRVIGAWVLGVRLNMGPFGLNLAMGLDWVVRSFFYIPRILTLKRLKTDAEPKNVKSAESDV